MRPTLIEQAGEITDLTYAIRRALVADDLNNAKALLEELRSSALALSETIERQLIDTYSVQEAKEMGAFVEDALSFKDARESVEDFESEK